MTQSHRTDDEGAIAIIGMACRFPGADSPEALWNNLRDGVQSLSRASDEELAARGVVESTRRHPNYVPVYSAPASIDLFDASFFGITPGEAECMDPQHRLMLECAHEALERSGFDFDAKTNRAGVFCGIGITGYRENVHHLLPDPLDLTAGRFSRDMQVGLGIEKCYACTRIAHKLNLKGPAVYVDAACATSLVAVHMACKSLLDYECDTAVAGGTKLELPYGIGYLYEEGGMSSSDGCIHAFDAQATGTLFGSGAGAVVLKRLEDARRDADPVLAVILGSAINNDGSDKVGFTAPSFEGQRSVILEALAFAGVPADSISYVEAHGTGTPLGDPIEIAALTAAYRAGTARKGYCAIGSLKTNVGHMEAASGVGGLIKTVLSLRHAQLPPSLNFTAPNREIDFANSPFFVNTRLRDWDATDGPRRAAVSSFGVGGTNAHLIVEEYIDDAPACASRPVQLLLWSAKTASALDAATARLAAHLQEHPQDALADVAFTLQRGRAAFSRRRMLVCDSREAAIAALSGDTGALVGAVSDGKVPPVAFLFPGQGAQHVGMAQSLYRDEPVFRDSLQECARLLAPHLDTDLLAVLYPPAQADAAEAAARLQQTAFAQPALFAIEYALAKLWQSWGVQPDMLLGHSIGEYVAACLAGVFTLADALRLVALRGRLMQSLPAGDMLAVPLAESELAGLESRGWDLAAVNGPRACVLSGPAEAIAEVTAELARRGVEGRRLHTSHAFHSRMTDPILDAFRAAVAGVRLAPPQRRYVSNVSGEWITAEQATSPDYWVQHLRGTVRFADGVRQLLARSGTVLLEVGPGQVLSALARQQEQARERVVVASLGAAREERDALTSMLHALGRLALANVDISWEGFYARETRRRVVLPTYPYERKRYWIDEQRSGRPRSGGAARLPLQDWFHAPSWSQQARVSGAPAAAQGWLLFVDGGGLGAQLAAALVARGDQVMQVTAGEQRVLDAGHTVLRPADAGDYQALVQHLAARGHAFQRVVHAWTLADSGGDYAQSQALGYYSLLHLLQALGQRGDATPLRLDVCSSGLADISGNEALDPAKASVLGPVLVAGHEHPELTCRHVDLGGVNVQQWLAELDAPAQPGERIALRGARRWQLGYQAVPLSATPAVQPWRERGTYLISGGLGGLGLVFARHLAEHYRARLVLTARQDLPPRHEWESWISLQGEAHAVSQRLRAVQELEALGAEVMTAGVDVTDADAMTALVAQAVQRFGAIHGAMHAAGIAGGGIIQRRSAAESEAVLAPKIRGAQVLLDVLQEQPLDIVVLHSSLFAVTGGAGQVDYCGANNVLDLMAQAQARQGRRVVSLNWDGWSDVGMAARSGLASGAAAPLYQPLGLALLDGVARSADGACEFVVDLDPARHWCVDEHRIDGHPVMPGTALLEMALAGFADAAGTGAAELRDVLFLSPLTLADAKPCRARLLLTPAAPGYRFRVQSRSGEDWRDHAVGSIGAAEAAPQNCDLSALRERTGQLHYDFAGREAALLPDDGWLSFGSRWHSVRRIQAGRSEALVELALPALHAADVADYRLHPALLDLATGLANGYWLEQGAGAEPGSPFLPFGYQRISVWHALPAQFIAHSRLCSEGGLAADSLVFDILLVDAAGTILVAIEGFSLKRVQPATLLAAAPKAARSPLQVSGIAPDEGLESLARVLASLDLPQVVICSGDLALRREFAAAAGADDAAAGEESARNERPDLASAFVAPRNDLEHRLSEIWQSLLGVRAVGIHDNFFELGGDSLLATQIPNRLRSSLNIGIDLGTVFQAPTIAQIAEHIGARQWAAEARTSADDTGREVGTL